MELTKTEKLMIGRRATRRINRKIYAWKKKNSDCLPLSQVHDKLVDEWYKMFEVLNGKQ